MTAIDRRIADEAQNGFGFEEIEQDAHGIWCDGCLTVHKRPTKMFTHDSNKTFNCRRAMVRFYNPEEQ